MDPKRLRELMKGEFALVSQEKYIDITGDSCNWCNRVTFRSMLAAGEWPTARNPAPGKDETMGVFCSYSCARQANAANHVGTIYPHRWIKDGKKVASSGCFITTAVCSILGKSDDCFELETLRSFRDKYMMTEPNRRELVHKYYRTAPAISYRLETSEDKKEEANYLLNNFISPACAAIESNDNQKAMNIYTDMMSYFGVDKS